MKLDYNWINLLILFGAVQGLIFCIILLFNRKHPGARFLSAFMFVLAYNGIETFNWSSGLSNYHVFFDLCAFILIFAVGPSLYLYVSALLHPERKLSGKTIFAHYAIVVFQFVIRTGLIVNYILWNAKIIRSDISPLQLEDIYRGYAEPLSVVVFLVYFGLSVHAFRKAGDASDLKVISKEGQQVVHRWIKALLYCMAILGVLWPLTVLSPYVWNAWYDSHYYPIELALVFFIYWIAFTGYHRTKLIYRRDQKVVSQLISTTEVERYLIRLQQAMEKEKLYLDPALNLAKVAAQTGISAKTISAILNQYSRQSFNDFVNDYRVREVREKLMAPENSHLTISGIALESGFNSQATFQRAFKSNMGMSPREYLALQLKKTG
jgi:AraC-like DNA-binding protein